LFELLEQIDPRISVQTFSKLAQTLAWLEWHTADLLVVNGVLPGTEATDLVRSLRAVAGHTDLPLLITVPWNARDLRRKVLEAGATDLLDAPVDEHEFRARCRNLLTQRAQQHIIRNRSRWLERRVSEATDEIRHREHETLLRLAKAGEYRDLGTGNHVVRMAQYARVIAEHLGLPDNECEIIELAAPMHDIGKIGIPDAILHKPGRLSQAEFEIMKTHTQIGYEILRDSPSEILQMGALIALNHHERFDSTGYPRRLGGADIPLAARIVAVADVYDALTSHRPYKRPWSLNKALEFLNRERGRHFDPECLDAFQARLDRVVKTQYRLSDAPARLSNGA
jgi:two-component system response regulator RpfG